MTLPQELLRKQQLVGNGYTASFEWNSAPRDVDPCCPVTLVSQEAGEEAGQNEVTLFAIGEGIRGKGDLKQVHQ